MVKRIARVIGCQTWQEMCTTDKAAHPEACARCCYAAQAAIAAMREPTEAMVEACDGMTGDAASPYEHWMRMIDAALK